MRDLYTALVAHLIFPLQERLKGHSTTMRLRKLEESQWWGRDRIEAERLNHLRRFLIDVGLQVPYYRRLFAEASFDPAHVRAIGDLAKIPLLTKPLIRANADALHADGAGALKRYNTGGSSGEPLIFYIGKDRVSQDVAAKWRATRWWDVDIGDREIVVWGSPIELGAQDRLRLVRDAVLRTKLLPAFEMSHANLDKYVAAIRESRPRMIFGYPSSLAHIASHAQANGRRLDDLGVRAVFVTSERLYDHQRTQISQAFGCAVANGYGSRDAGFIAHECPLGGMHISAEDIVVEIIGPDGELVANGVPGEIVVTHLATREFPFIRYRTGDIGTLDDRPCACGRGLALLKDLQGRSTDFVVAADGTVMHGLALIYTLRALSGLQQFKIIQESLDHTRVLLVPGVNFPADAAARIDREFRARLGQDVRVTVELVNEIPSERSGKFRYVISRIAANGKGRAHA